MANDGTVKIGVDVDGSAFSKLSGFAKSALGGITTAITAASAAVGGVAAAAVKVGSSFEESMSQVAATMGITTEEIAAGSEEFELLSKAAKEAGSTTAFSASEASSALNYLALAGYDAAKASDALPAVLNLAAAGSMDLAYASDLATDAMAALGIEASKESLTKFGDEMAKTASKANTSISQLGEAILTVGGTAKSLAGGTTELNAALGVLANRGIKGSEGGTALRNLILSLSAPTDKAAKVMEDLGLRVYDATGKMRPLNEVFKDLNRAMTGMSEGQKTQVLNEIFNKVDLKSAQSLLAGCGEEFDNLALAIENSGGAMQEMANTQLDNLNGDITILKSGLEGLGISLYEEMQAPLRSGVQMITDLVSQLSNALENDGLEGLVEKAGDILAQVLVEIANQLPRFIDMGVSVIQSLIDGLTSNLPSLLESTGQIAESFINGIVAILPHLQTVAGELFSSLIGYLEENLPQMVSAGLQTILSFSQGFRENAGNLVDSAIELVMTLADGIIEALPDLIATIPEIISNLAGAINDNAPKLLLAGAELIGKIILGLIQAIPDFILNAPKIVAAIVDVIMAFNWINLGSSIVKGLIDGVKSMFSSLGLTAKTLVQNWKVVISDLPGYFKAIGKDMIQGLINGIKSMADAVVENIKSIGKAVVSGLKSLLGIHSPSTVFAEIGKNIMLGLVKGLDSESDGIETKANSTMQGLSDIITDYAKYIQDIVPGYFETAFNTATGVFSALESVLSGDFESAGQSIKGIVIEWETFLGKTWDNIWAIFSDVSAFLGIGEDIVNNIKQGISDAWDNLVKFVTDGISNLIGSLSSFLGLGGGSSGGSTSSGSSSRMSAPAAAPMSLSDEEGGAATFGLTRARAVTALASAMPEAQSRVAIATAWYAIHHVRGHD